MNVQFTTVEAQIELPLPETSGGMPLHEALFRRRSYREFSRRMLTRQQISQLCWSAQGVTDQEGFRTAPSAGAIYPSVLFLATTEALFEYSPERHALQMRLRADVRKRLQAAALDQECVGEAPTCLIVSMNEKYLTRKYGERAARYCALEAGHIAQNVLLEATAMGLVGVPVGAFDDRRVSAVLELRDELAPVYLLPIGHPR